VLLPGAAPSAVANSKVAATGLSTRNIQTPLIVKVGPP
jgi:hypothetical protein